MFLEIARKRLGMNKINLQGSFDRACWWMTSFNRKFILGQQRRSIIFNFIVYLGSSRVLFSHNRRHIPFCFCTNFLSVSLWWEKKRNLFQVAFWTYIYIYTYIHWPCSVLFFPSIIIIIIHPVYLSRRQ
jgi:hypothetical protein